MPPGTGKLNRETKGGTALRRGKEPAKNGHAENPGGSRPALHQLLLRMTSASGSPEAAAASISRLPSASSFSTPVPVR